MSASLRPAGSSPRVYTLDAHRVLPAKTRHSLSEVIGHSTGNNRLYELQNQGTIMSVPINNITAMAVSSSVKMRQLLPIHPGTRI